MKKLFALIPLFQFIESATPEVTAQKDLVMESKDWAGLMQSGEKLTRELRCRFIVGELFYWG